MVVVVMLLPGNCILGSIVEVGFDVGRTSALEEGELDGSFNVYTRCRFSRRIGEDIGFSAREETR